jgi:hypothetical protein
MTASPEGIHFEEGAYGGSNRRMAKNFRIRCIRLMARRLTPQTQEELQEDSSSRIGHP